MPKVSIIEPTVSTRKLLYKFFTEHYPLYEVQFFVTGTDYLKSSKNEDLLIINIDLNNKVGNTIMDTLDLIGYSTDNIIVLSLDKASNKIKDYLNCRETISFIQKPFLMREISEALSWHTSLIAA
jgi:response regulator RpfG family c-di-GMP phosphodiesterase